MKVQYEISLVMEKGRDLKVNAKELKYKNAQ